MEYLNTLIELIIGAAFGAIAVFFILREKIKQYEKNIKLRRSTILEEVAGHIGKVSHVFSKYSSVLNEVGPTTDNMSPKQQQDLDELSTQLVEVYEEVSIAEAKLLLLGEKTLQKALKLYSGKMAVFRKQFYPGRYTDPEAAVRMKKELSSLRSQFYDILSQRYDDAL